MIRFLKKLFTRLPPREMPVTESDLIKQKERLEEAIEALVRQRRQREAIYLLEEEVHAITSDRFRRGASHDA